MKKPIGFSRVKFRHPFKLKGVEGEQLPGTYNVEVRDERPGWFRFLKRTSVSTWITIRHFHGINGALRDFRIVPRDLAAALRRDEEPRVQETDDKEGISASDSETRPVSSTKPKARTE